MNLFITSEEKNIFKEIFYQFPVSEALYPTLFQSYSFACFNSINNISSGCLKRWSYP